MAGRALRKTLATDASQPLDVPDITDIQIAQTHRRGFAPAVLSSLRHMLAQNQTETHGMLAETPLPVLAIWGGEDKVIPRSAGTALAQANPAAQQVTVPGAGHALPFSHAQAVLDAMLPHLERASS